MAADDELGEAYVAQADWDLKGRHGLRVPRASAGPVQAWREANEIAGRTLHARRPLAGLSPHPTGWRTAWPRPRGRTRRPCAAPGGQPRPDPRGRGENNLKDLSVELLKRRLTVFTGVSGSGKSSLVFSTIAAESQRMINETYSAFVQGFMPTLSRPEVDVLDGLTTAIVDQERMAQPRSTVGTATDTNAMLRILFSRLGKPHIGLRRTRTRSTCPR